MRNMGNTCGNIRNKCGNMRYKNENIGKKCGNTGKMRKYWNSSLLDGKYGGNCPYLFGNSSLLDKKYRKYGNKCG